METALAGGARHGGRLSAAVALSVAFLGPAGTYTEEALLASAPGEVAPEPRATVYETVMAVQEGETDRAVVPIENSLEGGVAATLDALAGEAERSADRGRGGPPDPPPPARRARARPRRAVRARALAPPGHRAVRALPARAAAPRRARGRHLHRRGRAHRSGTRASRGPRSAPGCPPSSTAAWCWPSAWRTTPTT